VVFIQALSHSQRGSHSNLLAFIASWPC